MMRPGDPRRASPVITGHALTGRAHGLDATTRGWDGTAWLALRASTLAPKIAGEQRLRPTGRR